MASGFPGSPSLLKGAFIQFPAAALLPVPSIIVFQYNPDSMTRTLHPWKPVDIQSEEEIGKLATTTEQAAARKAAAKLANDLSQPFDPDETMTLAIELDASDALEDSNPIAIATGIADRIAALEMLCYPPEDGGISGLLGSVASAIGGALGLGGGAADAVPKKEVPIILFSWGPGRIVPVRITSFSVEEQQYMPTLYPYRAKVSIGLQVLNENHLVNVASGTANSKVVEIAKFCYKFTQKQKQVLAIANLAHVGEARGILPF